MNPSCVCKLGRRRVNVPVVLDARASNDSVYITPALHETLLSGVDIDTIEATIHNRQVVFGPVIGILCNPVWDSKRQTLRTNTQLAGLQKMAEAARRRGALAYIFAIRDVHFDDHRIHGCVWRGGHWHRVWLPMPDVVYDQVISRKLEQNKVYRRKRERLSEVYQGRIFNDGFFDKWQVYEWLTGDKRTRRHIPNTLLYTRPKTCAQFIRAHGTTFLKPVHGSLGLGIIRVQPKAEGQTFYEIKSKQGREQRTAPSPEAAVDSLKPRLSKRPYLIQQGLLLAHYKDRPFDVRIVLQRNGEGEWRRTKGFARVAKNGEFTSNLSSGGEAMPVEKVLQTIFAKPSQRLQCRRQIQKVSHLVTTVIEEQSGKEFGELGIDIGIDSRGQVWIIEVNSKPWKRPFTESGRQDLVDRAFERPMEYAIFLASRPD